MFPTLNFGFDVPTDPGDDTITLRASSLGIKYGFNDGDLLSDINCRYNLSIDSSHEALCRVVENFLLPKLSPDVKTYRISTCHNPIRAEDEWLDYVSTCGIEVAIKVKDIIDFVEGI